MAALAASKIQLDRVKKENEEKKRELEATVVRYAVSEQAVIKAKTEAQANDKKVQEAKKEVENLQKRMKYLAADRSKCDKDFDTKVRIKINLHFKHILNFAKNYTNKIIVLSVQRLWQ